MPLLYLLLFLLPLTDLLAALAYTALDSETLAQGLRFFRLALAVGLGTLGFVLGTAPRGLVWSALIYGAFILIYVGVAFVDSRLSIGLAVSSAAQLSLPVLFVGVGLLLGQIQGGLRGARFFAILAVASALFGLWDISHTEFWIQTVRYGEYLEDIKGTTSAFLNYEHLPHNFYGFEEARRAGGLVAAPLAQGSFLAVGGLIGFALWRRSVPWLAYGVLALCAFGVYQSGTRGALLILLIAWPLFMVLSLRHGYSRWRSLAIVALGVVAVADMVIFITSYTVGLEDGSTIGHVTALEDNLAEIGQVLVFGAGLGEAGPLASDGGLDIAGGGEGSFFSVAFQLGVPGGLAFMAFYGVLGWRAWRRCQSDEGQDGAFALAITVLMVACASSLIISEHLLSSSALGGLWLLAGAVAALPEDAERSHSQLEENGLNMS